MTSMVMMIPDTDNSVTVTVTPPSYVPIDPKRTYSPGVSGNKGRVLDNEGKLICHCYSYEAAENISDALNFWSRAQLLDGNHWER